MTSYLFTDLDTCQSHIVECEDPVAKYNWSTGQFQNGHVEPLFENGEIKLVLDGCVKIEVMPEVCVDWRCPKYACP